MFVENLFELYANITAWYMNNVIYNLLVMLGIPLFPFAFIMVRNIMQARTLEQNQATFALRATEADFIRMIPVIMLMLVPIVEVESNYLDKAPKICSTTKLEKIDLKIERGSTLIYGQNRETNFISINNTKVKVPILLGLIQTISTGISYVVTKAIPCKEAYDIATVKMTDMYLTDPNDQKFAKQFISKCYIPTLNRAQNSSFFQTDTNPNTTPTGSFIEHFYNKFEMNYNTNYWNMENGIIKAKLTENGEARINCRTAYNHIYALAIKRSDIVFEGLEKELKTILKLVNKKDSNKDKLQRAADTKVNLILGTIIKDGFNASRQQISRNHIDLGWLDEIGAILSTIPDLFASNIARITNPMLLSLFQLLFIMMIPIILVATSYSMKSVLIILSGIFTLEFTNSIFALGSWINEALSKLILEDHAFIKSNYAFIKDEGVATIILAKIAFMCHSFLPIAYLTLMSGVGFFAGSSAAAKISGAASAIGQTGGAYSVSALRFTASTIMKAFKKK